MRQLLRKTGIRAKMTLILALMSLPYPILLVLLISQQNIAIHFAEKEELGAEYNLLLFQVYSAAEQNALNPEELQALDKLDASLGEELGTEDRWKTLRTQLNGVSSAQRRRAFLDLNTRVGDISNLILDPDLDSYYMMDITTIRLPLLQTRIIALTENVEAALRRGHIGEAEREHLLLEATLVDEQIEGIRHSQQTVIEYNAAVQPELAPVHQRFADAMKSYQGSVKAALDQANAEPSDIAKAGRQASVEVVAFYEQSSSLLTKLLAKRVSGFVLQRTLTTAGVVLLIAVSITLTFLLIGSIVNPLGILRRRMDEIADGAGDLSSRLTEDLPDADLSLLSASFNRFLVRIRDIVTEARRLAARQAGSAHDLKETSAEFGHNMQAEAAGMEEISASMEEIFTSAEQVAGSIAGTVRTADDLMQNMDRLSTILAKTTTLIGQTSSLTDSTVLRAKDGQTGMQSILDNIADIQQSSKLIDDILAIIEEVADRINLLSLNAAIEAARAGDAGRGFAVVAQEVSRLADQTNRSTTDIGNLIKENTIRIERGSETIRSTVAAINAVIESVGLISRQVLEIAALIPEEDRIRQEVHASTDELKAKAAHIQHSSEEQKSAIDEVTRAIVGINEAVQHSALHSAHVLDRAVDVDADAEQMTALVKKFRT